MAESINFGKKIEDYQEAELKRLIDNSDTRFGQIAFAELLRRSLDKLDKNIDKNNKQSSVQTKKMIRLTWWIVVLTIAMLFGLVVQIFLAIKQ